MRFYKKICVLAMAACLSAFGSTAFASTILLVPQDDRPVSLDYTVNTAERAGYTVLTPPRAYLSGKNFRGSPDLIWRWVEQNMVRADAAVLSTDTLIYGGLVDSRKHNEPLTTLMARENRIRALHAQYPKIPIYGFGTIMRTPYASSGGVEPYYYSKYGNDLYRLSGLQDKMDAGKITPDETAGLLSLKLSIPSEYLQDWFKRRTKNNTINRMLIKDTKSGVFAYYSEGHDDNSKNSQSTLESRYLAADAKGLPESRYGSFPGADQLALLLIARYHDDSHHLKPAFSVIYPLGRAENTVPSYENQPIGKTISEHIAAVGGVMAGKNVPDIVLAVNTPIASTGESGQFSNFGMMKQSTTDFMNEVKNVIGRGIPVSMVDVYFANGSDNTLMNLMVKDDLLYKVAAYNGWNTASNTIGYAIAQAILAPSMSAEDHKNMLTEQYIDNWAYQANVRKNIARMTELETNGTTPTPAIKQEMIAEVQEFAKKKMGLNPATVSADFPWNRLFEINALVSTKPKYTVYLTRAEQQRIAEEKAKAEAEAEARKKAGEPAAPAASDGQPAPADRGIDTAPDDSGDISTIVINK
ncbi:DUF4127 family protein [uncultured Dialister sp.]|uniref:DUF4127 family protein n=1 Tax=uncultured Dialister sp. TaxID=278064 RepID=UPI00262360E4|nr:DUF4127 family protein [uncultured Dialister sp.]